VTHRLVLAARGADALNEMAQVCERLGSQVLAISTDVTKEEQCKFVILHFLFPFEMHPFCK
jgi:NADP-dependent 3-hydroxy acid dehydrogenase YdfG